MKSWELDEHKQRLIFDGLAALLESEEDPLAKEELLGDEAIEQAETTRRLLLTTVKTFRLRPLQAAMANYLTQSEALRSHRRSLPGDATSRRRLLTELFRAIPDESAGSLTIQHRDFKKLSDADVESLLNQLRELGVWNGTLPKKPK